MAVQKRTTKSGAVRWVGRYRDHSGRERSKSFDTQRDAKAWVAEQERALRRGEWVDPAEAKITVREVMVRWAARPIRDNTRRSYELTIAELGPLAGIPVRHLTRGDVDAWHAQLLNGRPWHPGDMGMAESTAREHVVRLSAAVNYAVDSDLATRNVVKVPRATKGVVAVRRSELPTPEQIGRVIALLESGGAVYEMQVRAPGGGWQPKRVEAAPSPVVADMVRVVVGTGVRLSEACGLLVENVDFLRRGLVVEKQISVNGRERVSLKTGSSERVVPLADDALAVLDRSCSGRASGEFVFTNRSGRAFRAATAGAALRQVVGHLGYEFTFHSFRHYYASFLIAAGVPVTGVQAALGHGSAATTLGTYSHLWPAADEVTRTAIAGAVAALAPGEGFVRDRGGAGLG